MIFGRPVDCIPIQLTAEARSFRHNQLSLHRHKRRARKDVFPQQLPHDLIAVIQIANGPSEVMFSTGCDSVVIEE